MASLGLFELLLQNIGRLLVLALLVGGLVLAVQRQSRHPMVSLYVSIGLVAAIVQVAAGFGLQWWLASSAASGGYSGNTVFFTAFGFLQTALELVSVGFLIAAAFVDRGPAPPPHH